MIANVKVRNCCLDFMKGIACIFVVFMHCEFPGYLGIFVQCISRFSVPFFFMVSGYFYYKKRGGTNVLKKIRHIGSIVLGATLFYVIVTPLYHSGISISVTNIAYLLLFNVPFYIAGQMWFLFALLYVYIFFAVVEKYKLRKLAYMAIPIGIFVYILMAQGAHLLGYSVPNMLYRNFLIEGLPLFALGFWIHEHQDDINISNRTLLLAVVIATLFCPVERMIMGRDFGVNIVTFLQVTSLFLLGVKNPGFGAGKTLSQLGLKYSMYVYIVHPAVWHLLEKLYKTFGMSENIAALYILPILCVSLTILCSVIFVRLKTMMQEKVFKEA